MKNMTLASTTLAIAGAVRERRSIRAFSDSPVAAETIEELLRDAVWAPSPHNAQPWRFTMLLTDEAKAGLAGAMAEQLTRELTEDGLEPEQIERQTGRSRRRISTAPVVLLCSLVRDGLVPYGDARRHDLEWQMAVQSVGAVLQTLMLLAAERGIGSCWMAAPMYCPEVVLGALDLPEDFSPQALVLMGYPEADAKARPRRPLGEVLEIK